MKKYSAVAFIASLITILSLSSSIVVAKDVKVNSPEAYRDAMKAVKPGDSIIIANGRYSDFEILFKAEGAKGKPITLKAEEKGKVILTGQSNLRLAGKYLVVKGLVFKDGYTPTSEVISFKQNNNTLAFHSRVTEVVIDNFSNPDKDESDYWVGIYGQHNRFDHNFLAGKRNKGVTLAVRLNSESSLQNYHRIDHNYFGPRPVFGSNGGETLRIGTSHFSLSDSNTLVENNYFDRCNGEVEIISVKSGHNILRNNVFFESRGTLTLRHGNGNLVEGNVFFGNGVDHTGGIRVINKDQIVRNNYLEGLTGYRFGSGLTVMNGVPNSPINRYHQVENALIENNTLIDVEHVHLAAGSDVERSAAPINSAMKNNLIYSKDGQDKFSIFDSIEGITFSGNYLHKVKKPKISQGFNVAKIKLKRAANGLLYPVGKAYQGVGAAKDLAVIKKSEVGPNWYPKNELAAKFDSGKTIEVKPAENALVAAVAKAQSGDVIELQAGEYNIEKIVFIDKTLTIRAEKLGAVTLKHYRTTFMEIKNGGSLKLENLVIDGKEAPDSRGNTLIRTSKWGMFVNYSFVIKNSVVRDLDVNKNFHFFDAGSRSFADAIRIEKTRFENISGDILRLNKEIDDIGIYNAEYIDVIDSTFEDVGGVLANVYRGGRDESTFGPHITMVGNSVSGLGLGKTNKSGASLRLHGVQVSQIDKNTFLNSAGIVVEHTVGEPITRISENRFINTPKPSAVEIAFKGPHTAIIENNTSK